MYIIAIIAVIGILVLSETVRDFVELIFYSILNNLWIAGLFFLLLILLPFLYFGGWIAFWGWIGRISFSPIATGIVAFGILGSFFLRKFIPKWIWGIAIFSALVSIFIGLCSPEIKKAGNRYATARQEQVANIIDKETLKIEPRGFIPGKMKKDSFIYDEYGRPTPLEIKKGDKVDTVSLLPKRFGDSEVFVKIMIPNDLGDSIGGTKGYVPYDRINLGNKIIDNKIITNNKKEFWGLALLIILIVSIIFTFWKKTNLALALLIIAMSANFAYYMFGYISNKKPTTKWHSLGRGIVTIQQRKIAVDLSALGLTKPFPSGGKVFRIVESGDDPDGDNIVPGLFAKLIDKSKTDKSRYVQMPLSEKEFSFDGSEIGLYAIGSDKLKKGKKLSIFWRYRD